MFACTRPFKRAKVSKSVYLVSLRAPSTRCKESAGLNSRKALQLFTAVWPIRIDVMEPIRRAIDVYGAHTYRYHGCIACTYGTSAQQSKGATPRINASSSSPAPPLPLFGLREQVVLPALSGNRSLQRLVSEYYDTLDLSSEGTPPPPRPPPPPRSDQQIGQASAAAFSRHEHADRAVENPGAAAVGNGTPPAGVKYGGACGTNGAATGVAAGAGAGANAVSNGGSAVVGREGSGVGRVGPATGDASPAVPPPGAAVCDKDASVRDALRNGAPAAPAVGNGTSDVRTANGKSVAVGSSGDGPLSSPAAAAAQQQQCNPLTSVAGAVAGDCSPTASAAGNGTCPTEGASGEPAGSVVVSVFGDRGHVDRGRKDGAADCRDYVRVEDSGSTAAAGVTTTAAGKVGSSNEGALTACAGAGKAVAMDVVDAVSGGGAASTQGEGVGGARLGDAGATVAEAALPNGNGK